MLIALFAAILYGSWIDVGLQASNLSSKFHLVQSTSEWIHTTPEAQGIDSEKLVELLDEVLEHNHQIDSISIVRNGHVVLDASIFPFQQDSKHILYSCTKSVVSALIGIAIDRGFIEGVHQRIVDIFPDLNIANLDDRKLEMKLEHVLTMTTGLACRDSYLYRWTGLGQMRSSADWVQHVLDLPMSDSPGEKFEYCNGASHLLSAIISKTTGMSALEFAKQHLFEPLGITDIEWPSDPNGITVGFSELHLRPLDMAKIGQLYLKRGTWADRQVVSSEWVQASTGRYIEATLQDAYGYQWWIDSSGMYLALGYRGQFIYVIPHKQMVVVYTSHLDEDDFYLPQQLLNNYIILAARSTSSLPENAEGNNALRERIEALAAP